ncbi:Beta-catenin-like protein 1 [Phytophthora pseudosyringae]|uniref:Beta-catenin-like protein 1 n=1 Tax=Phytophthora pseudosyringae TaxID=221518 RepID=A0A8T1VHL3_9STRA|nr:Beta-catenin-like protein 1 [Phytophthora pseudosyringae]
MESHFERVLAAEAAPKRPATSPASSSAPKRARVSPEANAAKISAIVDGAEAQEGDALDARALKSMANSLQKHVRRNALAREKHADEPAKFLESELALDNELTRWTQVAAKPELFAVMTELQVPRVLLGLFAHENLDIRLAVLGLLAELTDVDESAESLEPARRLAKHLMDEKLLPLLVTNLCQLATAVDNAEAAQAEEETTGIYNSLQILENLADLEPQVCAQVAGSTPILPFLLQQVAPGRTFGENKLYASEILSILLQAGAEVREKFVAWMGKERASEEKRKEKDAKVDLMDDLLQALAPYRKKDPSSEEEEELVGNLVNALCSALLVPEAQKQFRRLEGLELLLRFMKDRKRFVFGGALRALDHALMGNARNCERLVEIGGLRSIFSVFMGRHGKYKSSSSNTKASKASEKAKEEENAASLVASMCAWIREKAPADGYDRLHGKFVENEMEKVDRLVDLFAKYHERVERSGHDEEDDEDEDEDSRYLRRLDAGLFVLERVAFVVAHLCRFSKKLRAYVMVKFHERSIESESLVTILREQLDLLVTDEAGKKEGEEFYSKDAKDAKDVVNGEAKEAQKAQLRELLKTLETEEAPLKDDQNGSVGPDKPVSTDERKSECDDNPNSEELAAASSSS